MPAGENIDWIYLIICINIIINNTQFLMLKYRPDKELEF